MRQKVPVKSPECEQRKVRKRGVNLIRLPRRESEERSDESDRPALQQEEVASHPIYGGLQELKMLVLVADVRHGAATLVHCGSAHPKSFFRFSQFQEYSRPAFDTAV